VLYAALVTLSHTYRSNMQPCDLSAAIVPSEWCSALVHPILKPNIPDPRNPANYRGIALQSVVLKVLCKVLNGRLPDWSETCQMSRIVLDLTVLVWTIFMSFAVLLEPEN